jgi:hypothetical protein
MSITQGMQKCLVSLPHFLFCHFMALAVAEVHSVEWEGQRCHENYLEGSCQGLIEIVSQHLTGGAEKNP